MSRKPRLHDRSACFPSKSARTVGFVWGAWTGCSTIAPSSAEVDPKDLDDQKLIEQIPKANLSNIHTLCTQIVERDLGDEAVPGLVALWNRFKGFGS